MKYRKFIDIIALSLLVFLGLTSFTKIVHAANEESEQPPEGDQKITTGCLEVYPYLGLAIDNFSASSAKQYFNHEDSGKIETRETFGVFFQYPFGETDNQKIDNKVGNCQSKKDSGTTLWLYGLTAHGVRSAELDCSDSNSGICSDKTDSKSLGILRDATSLEAHLGLRWEFMKLQHSNSAAFASYQYGLASVRGGTDDAAEISHFGLGFRVRSGKNRNSYIEFGRGRNDLILDKNNDRIKFNARLVQNEFNWFSTSVNAIGFIHLSVDVDGGSGSDSIQTYIGVTY